MHDPQRLLVLSPNWLGDAVMALPAIADLGRRHPRATLTVAARGAVAGLFPLVPGVHAVKTLRWRGQPLRLGALNRDADLLRQGRFDAAILLTNSFGTAWLARRAGIPERWGYARDLRTALLSRAIAPPRHSLHQGRYYQALTTALGAPAGPLEPIVHVPSEAQTAARVLLESGGWNGTSPLMALAPGAAYGTAKRWLPRHFASIVTDLAGDGVTSVLLGGPSDRETIDEVVRGVPAAIRERVIDLAGQTSLATLAAVLQTAAVCVANDSGAMHLAAAVGSPTVALFGPTRETETAPLVRAGRSVDVLTHPVWCRPCMLRECPIDHRCLRDLTPARVAAVVRSRFSGGRSGETLVLPTVRES